MKKFSLTADHRAKIRDEHFRVSTLDKTVTMWGYYLQGAEAAASVLAPEIEALEKSNRDLALSWYMENREAQDAYSLLDDIASSGPGPISDRLKYRIAEYLGRYAVKKPGPWVKVTDRWPEPMQRVNFVVDLPGRYEHGKVYGGTYVGDAGHEKPYRQNGFAVPGTVYPASHWCPAPASPVQTDDNNQTITITTVT